jgi:hypothetical protein
MIWLAWKLLTLPIRLVLGTLGITFRTIRFVGVGRLLFFGAGVGTGMALSPNTGDQLRERLAQVRNPRPPLSATDLGALVRDELAHSPRTWHLPQPAVTVVDDRVTLTGEVPHESARADLGRTAGAVTGVAAVDNQIRVVPADD